MEERGVLIVGNGNNGNHAPGPLRGAEREARVRALLQGTRNGVCGHWVLNGREFGDRYLGEYAPLLSHSRKMEAVREVIERVADTTATVLIQGESGVGKEVVARAIHCASPRRDHPFVKINCAAFPAELLESELFGHERGAFTGAYQRKPGRFELANKGTLFLDEIGELPVALQAKILHVLQDSEFSRVGGREILRVDVRIIASTNRDLERAIQSGQFREDLYYRLNVVEIRVPPLRERKEEIPILASYFLGRCSRQYERTVAIPPETMELLGEYAWPGNVRELENVVRRLVVLGNVQQVHEQILARLGAAPSNGAPPSNGVPIDAGEETGERPTGPEIREGLRDIARRAARDAERRAIREMLDRVRWNRTTAARLLKVSYRTLIHKMRECGLGPEQRLHPGAVPLTSGMPARR